MGNKESSTTYDKDYQYQLIYEKDLKLRNVIIVDIEGQLEYLEGVPVETQKKRESMRDLFKNNGVDQMNDKRIISFTKLKFINYFDDYIHSDEEENITKSVINEQITKISNKKTLKEENDYLINLINKQINDSSFTITYNHNSDGIFESMQILLLASKPDPALIDNRDYLLKKQEEIKKLNSIDGEKSNLTMLRLLRSIDVINCDISRYLFYLLDELQNIFWNVNFTPRFAIWEWRGDCEWSFIKQNVTAVENEVYYKTRYRCKYFFNLYCVESFPCGAQFTNFELVQTDIYNNDKNSYKEKIQKEIDCILTDEEYLKQLVNYGYDAARYTYLPLWDLNHAKMNSCGFKLFSKDHYNTSNNNNNQ